MRNSATFPHKILPVDKYDDVRLVLDESCEHLRVDLLDRSAEGERGPVRQPLKHVQLALEVALVRNEVAVPGRSKCLLQIFR